jgi:RNA polymerase sigma-70 factor (ECF subfamily)
MMTTAPPRSSGVEVGEADLARVCRFARPRLQAFFVRRTRDGTVSEDLVQDTLLRVCAAWPTFDGRKEAMPWVFRIARNVLIDRARTRRVEVPIEPERLGDSLTPCDLVEARETADLLREALARVPGACRAAFELVRQEGLSVAEAAARLQTTPSAIKLRTHRASKALRAELAAA